MSLYVFSDPHLSLGTDKPMGVFSGWDDYENRIRKSWTRLVGPEDSVMIPGDISWAMKIEEALPDLKFLDSLPGHKYMFKGNHDFWYPTKSKLNAFLEQEKITTITTLYHEAVLVEGKALCGTRSWFYDEDNPDEKVFKRELMRLEMALKDAASKEADEIICFLHYPPIYKGRRIDGVIELLQKYGVRRCYYGHIHGDSIQYAFNGEYGGIQFRLVSADALGFAPLKI